MPYELDPDIKMSPEQFKIYLDEMLEHCLGLLVSKNKDYAKNGDKVWNFRRAAQIENSFPVKALRGMMTKHVVSIYDMIDDLEKGVVHPPQVWKEKLGDHINYLFLAWAFICEMADQDAEDFWMDQDELASTACSENPEKVVSSEGKKAILDGGKKDG
jgi:hypothetical protein